MEIIHNSRIVTYVTYHKGQQYIRAMEPQTTPIHWMTRCFLDSRHDLGNRLPTQQSPIPYKRPFYRTYRPNDWIIRHPIIYLWR